jgi:hypothetical protein
MATLHARWLVLLALPVLTFLLSGETSGTEAPPVDANLLVDVSREFLGAVIEEPIDRTEPVCDVILKTRIRGTGRTIAKVGVELVPNDQVAEVDFVTTGTTTTQTVGVNGPVQLYSDSTIPFQIHQRATFRPDGVLAEGTWSHADNRSTLTGLTTDLGCLLDRVVQKIACKQYRKNKDKADAIASRHAEDKYIQGALAEAGPKLDEADRSFKKGLADLRAKGVVLAALRFSTSRDTLYVRASVAGPGIAAFGPPPTLKERSYLSVRVHESFINEAARANLAGKTFTGEQLEDEAKNLGSGKTPKQADDTDWSITFAKEKPVEVAYADQGFRMVIRLAEFTSSDNEYSGMDMTVKYKFQKAGATIKAVRSGPIEAFPPGFQAGKKLSARQQAMRTVLQKRFGKIFKEELEITDMELPDDLQKAGPLVATRAEADRGWLLLTWRKGMK